MGNYKFQFKKSVRIKKSPKIKLIRIFLNNPLGRSLDVLENGDVFPLKNRQMLKYIDYYIKLTNLIVKDISY